MGFKSRSHPGALSDTTPEMWRALLSEFFEELLQQPLSGFDSAATYAVYHHVDSDLFGGPKPTMKHFCGKQLWMLTADTKNEPESPNEALMWRTCQAPIDLSNSFVLYESKELSPGCVHNVCTTNKYEEVFLTGKQLAEVAGKDLKRAIEQVSSYAYRIKTDGTLFDAMLTTLLLREAPEGATIRGAEPEEPTTWIREQVSEIRFQEHLSALCSDRDAYVEVPGVGSLLELTSSWATPILSYYTGGWHWHIVKLPECPVYE